MTDKPTHTPLPWKVADGADQYICNGDHWIASTMGIRGEEGAANAAFIVQAVNSHHDLIEALREELVWHEDHDKAISKQPNANTGDNGWRRMEHQERIAALTAILTKAEAGHG